MPKDGSQNGNMQRIERIRNLNLLEQRGTWFSIKLCSYGIVYFVVYIFLHDFALILTASKCIIVVITEKLTHVTG